MKLDLFWLILILIMGSLVVYAYKDDFYLNSDYKTYNQCQKINESQIKSYQNYIYIEDNLTYGTREGAKSNISMLPSLPLKHTGLFKSVTNINRLCVGDIITFNCSGLYTMHRIKKINKDKLGYYYITKGDYNKINDDCKVRYNDIKYVLVGILF